MVLQVIILLMFIAMAFMLSPEKVLLITLFILPFHFFLKSILNTVAGSSDLFSSWKEIVLIILFFRVLLKILKKEIGYNRRYPMVIILLYFTCSTLLFIAAGNKSDALISYKNFSFPLICFFISANLQFNKIDQKGFIKIVSYSALLVFIIAHLQHYVFSYQFAVLMNLINTVTSTGQIIYSQGASQIMGIDRMYGCFVGPNELGLYTTLVLMMIITLLVSQKLTKKERIILYLIAIIGISTLLQTFSRVSWFLFVFTAIFYFGVREKNFKAIIIALICFIPLIAVGIALIPNTADIIDSTVHLKEASAQGRSSVFFDGLAKIIDNPFGFGLGTIQYSSSNPRKMWTEIYWWLVFGENGLLIGGLLFIVYFKSALRIFKFNINQNVFAKTMPIYMLVIILGGFASIIIFEPIYQVYLWSFVGIAYNKQIILDEGYILAS